MKNLRVLITGGTGLLALNWACAVRQWSSVVLGGHTHTVKLDGTEFCKLELDDLDKLNHQISKISPDVIVHAAGLTSVDACEKNPGLARHVNAELAGNIAIISKQLNIKLIHISTDHLFSGVDSYYSETSVHEPLNEYAKSKSLAEELVLNANDNALILRTNFFGWGYRNRQSFSDWIINSMRDRKKISMFDDVYVTPILADKLATYSHDLIQTGATGIFNMVGDERISKFEFGKRIAKHFDLPVELIVKSKISDSSLSVKRPLDMSLDNSKVTKKLKKNIGGLDEFFTILRHQEKMGRYKELFDSVK